MFKKRACILSCFLFFVLSFSLVQGNDQLAPVSLETTTEDGSLSLVVTVIRHGDRTPFEQIKNSPVDWKSGVSELTPLGMRQEFMLGQALRETYIEKQKFLKENFVPNTIYVLSSDTNRTIMSAESLLYGLYPLGTGPLLDNGEPSLAMRFQPVPIRTLPADSDEIMLRYDKLLKAILQYAVQGKDWREKEKAHKKDYQKWSEILGNKIENLGDINTISDVLLVRKKYGIPLPKGLSKEEAEKIIKLGDWMLCETYKNEQISYLSAGQLLKRIVDNFNQKAENKNPYQFMLYSGHDITLLPLMALLGSPLDEAPKYASHVELEMYKKDKSYYLKVRYNGKYVHLPLMEDKENTLSLENLNMLLKSHMEKAGELS